MKQKLFTLFLALIASVVTTFAARYVVPSDAVLKNYYKTGQLCVCIFVPAEMACNDVVFVGTYNRDASDAWITDVNKLAKFQPVEGYDGWYVVAVDDETPANFENEKGIQGKPIVLDQNGAFNWQYQVSAATKIRGGVEIVSGFYNIDEIDLIRYTKDAPNVYTIDALKGGNPCTAVYHNYTFTVISDGCDGSAVPYFIGDMTDWKFQQMQLNEAKTQEFGAPVYYYNIKCAEGMGYQIVSGLKGADGAIIEQPSWDDDSYLQQLVYNVWLRYTENDNVDLTTGADVNITFDVRAADLRWARCASEDSSTKSGTCGDNLTWILSNGTLTISGTGAMANYEHSTAPWYVYWPSILSVIISDGVTSIGDYAFQHCESLTSVTIPNSVTWMGSNAFYGCSSLTSVTINSDAIVNKAYTDSDNLSDIFGSQVTKYIIGDNVKGIGEYAFYDCSSLTSVTIPNSVTSIGDYAFKGCSSLTSPVYNAHCFACMPSSYSGAYTIPKGIKQIAGSAFSGCSSLTSITIPNSVTSIGEWAFNDCSSLTSVHITDLAAWCKISFGSANANPLYYAHNIYLNGELVKDLVIPNSVTSIGGNAFRGCSSLTSITIPNSVTSIGEWAFEGCSSLTSVTIPNSVTSIGEYAFMDCSSLTSVHITDLAAWCKISFGSANANPLYYAHNIYLNGELVKDLVIPNSVTSIGDGAFCDCSSLTSVTIPNSVTSIGNWAFEGCSSLTSITIPNSVISIGWAAFRNCSSLTSVTVEAETPPTLGNSVFISTNNCPIYVPCGTLDDYKTAWSAYASRIKYVPYSYTITPKAINGHITTSSTDFTMCDTEYPVICTAIPNRGYYFVRWADGSTENPRTIELTQDTTMEAIFDYLLKGKCGKDSALTWMFEPASMALNITGKGALSENYTYGTFIESLTIGNSVTSIGYGAFSECSSLTSVTIGNSVTSIGGYAFGECESLKTVVLGSSVKVLEAAAFAYCSSIETITCYSMRPPTVNQDALYRLDYSTIVYVPADYLNTYKMHDAWGLYDVRPLGATSAETEDVKITPSENEANVTWPSVSGAASYELVIKDKDGNIICTLIFNANGQLTSMAFNAPSRNGAPAQTQNAGFSFTITGLDSGTGYNLTLTAKNNSGNIIEETTIPFHTDYPEGIEDISSSSLQGGDRGRLILRDGQVLILRNGKTYTMQGQEVK